MQDLSYKLKLIYREINFPSLSAAVISVIKSYHKSFQNIKKFMTAINRSVVNFARSLLPYLFIKKNVLSSPNTIMNSPKFFFCSFTLLSAEI